ncbi:hypothetical protein GPJ56_007181 [Histomonas meleagridis]|uniref:uncharacterized protein n=1 Tax=Histomonas meleagridis TaxID=135588 RepID=UPI00355A7B12|nr:hypothetical protein GPJ56_007181 [Histomonas meleagridis]KAH0800105.1 hypothetical protein GO595_007217 [Histomonas meleagridis]
MSLPLVAYDYSGSTCGCTFYHDTVQSLLKKYPNYDVIYWSHVLKVASKEELAKTNKERRGSGCTEPILVAKYCVEKEFTGDLILITDGQIPESSVRDLDNYIKEHDFHVNHVDCYLIQTCSDKMDATVIAPFLRGNLYDVYLYPKGETESSHIISGGKTSQEFIEQIRSIKTIEEFEKSFEELFSLTITSALGKSDLSIKDEITRLQKRLLMEMKQVPEGFDIDKMEKSFWEGNLPEMIRLTKELNATYHQKYDNITWPPKLFHLIRMSSGNLNSVFSLSALGSKFNADRVRRADVIENIQTNELEILELSQETITCPILYEDESDIVLLISKPDKPILEGEDSNIINTIINNPLNAIRYPHICEKIINCLDHPISLRAYKEAEETGYPIEKSPITRRELIGCLSLVQNETHIKYTDKTLANLLFAGKSVGYFDLWYALIWYLIKDRKIEYLQEIIPQLTEQLRFRFRYHKGTFFLTNVPYYCITHIPIGIACWCSLCSNVIGVNEKEAMNHIKSNVTSIPILQSIISELGYPIPQEAKDFLKIARTYLHIKEAIRKNDFDKLMPIILLAHKCIEIDTSKVDHKKYKYVPKYIPIDGNDPDEQQVKKALSLLPSFFSELTIDERRVAAKLVEIGDINQINMNEFKNKINGINWGYGLNDFRIPVVNICPKTCRPYYNLPQKSTTWLEQSEKIFGPIDQQIHIHFLYIQYVLKYNQFPNKDEFLVFVFHQFIPEKKPTLPKLIGKFVDNVLEGYGNVVEKYQITPELMVERCNNSIPIVRREKIEKKYLK